MLTLTPHISEPYKLKPCIIPIGFSLIVDTREQLPLLQSYPDLPIIHKALKDGDYSIPGFEEMFCIERKRTSDLLSYVGSERQSRTIKKMERFSKMKWVGLAIEASEDDILTQNMFSKVNPETVRQSLVSFEIRVGIHIYYSRSRENVDRWVLDRAIKFFRMMREVR